MKMITLKIFLGRFHALTVGFPMKCGYCSVVRSLANTVNQFDGSNKLFQFKMFCLAFKCETLKSKFFVFDLHRTGTFHEHLMVQTLSVAPKQEFSCPTLQKGLSLFVTCHDRVGRRCSRRARDTVRKGLILRR